MREMRREPEVREARVPVVECLDGPARITSKELAPIHCVSSGILQNACSTSPRVVEDFGEKCSYAHRQVDKQPGKRSKKNGDKSAVAMLKKHELHEGTGQPVVNSDKSHDRTGQPVVNRDTRHESNHETCSVQIIEYTTIGLCLSGHGAAEVSINLTEELRHAETNPTCEIHEGYCTSH